MMSTNRIAELGAWVENLQASREIVGRNVNDVAVQAIMTIGAPSEHVCSRSRSFFGAAALGRAATHSRRPTVGAHHAVRARPTICQLQPTRWLDAVRGIRAGAHVR